ncbi:MAG: class I SAM-dependent methyltransferase [Gaiellaceae bacterium]
MSIDRSSARAFASVAELYERRRPSYPQELVDWVAERLDLRPGRTVADIGAGTGKLTRLLAATGARVVAIEPLDEMRAYIPDSIESLAGSAESLPLEDESVDALTAAAAFHWFDPGRAYPELHRVLRTNGLLAVVGNHRELDDPVQNAVQDVVGGFVPTLDELASWQDDLAASRLFEPLDEFHAENEQLVDAVGLAERVGTISYVARLPDDERAVVLERVRAIGEAQPEHVFAFRYRSDAYVFSRRDAD